MKKEKDFINDKVLTFIVVIFACVGIIYFSIYPNPSLALSGGIVAIICALTGVWITVMVTRLLLNKQYESQCDLQERQLELQQKFQKELLEAKSEEEALKDKGIKIYEKKISVYSEFIKQMWGMLDKFDKEEGVITFEDIRALRELCFKELVFYLNNEQIKKISDQIKTIEPKEELGYDSICEALGAITYILQKNLDTTIEIPPGQFKTLYGSFKTKSSPKDTEQPTDTVFSYKQNQETSDIVTTQPSNITFWHFNMLGEQQLEQFNKGNWILNLIEYGEDWRTWKVRHQVKPDDVVFLFRRGGYGYIGAFKVVVDEKEGKCFKILEGDKNYEPKEIEKFDIYNSLADGSTLSSNIFVEPIAYNYKGVGYHSVRRSTIEKMNKAESYLYLLERFSEINLPDEKKNGMGKLNENDDSKIDIKSDYFNTIRASYLK